MATHGNSRRGCLPHRVHRARVSWSGGARVVFASEIGTENRSRRSRDPVRLDAEVLAEAFEVLVEMQDVDARILGGDGDR